MKHRTTLSRFKKKKGLETTVLYARAETSKEHIVNVRYSWFNLQVSKGLPTKDCLLLKKRTAVVFALERNTHFRCFAQLTGKPRPDSSPLYPLEILFLLRASPSLSYWSPPPGTKEKAFNTNVYVFEYTPHPSLPYKVPKLIL